MGETESEQKKKNPTNQYVFTNCDNFDKIELGTMIMNKRKDLDK